MIGAIIGDIVGSRFEFDNHRSKEFELFTDADFCTDDTVMTLAIGKALKECGGKYEDLSERAIHCMREIGRHYPDCGYGGSFYHWIYGSDPKPYNSYGNGAAMRVSACGEFGRTLDEVKWFSAAVTAVTHNHPEGMKGAEATAVAIFLAKSGRSKEEIGDFVRNNYYTLDFTLDEIRPTYRFNETCQGTVPQAIEAFLESTDFEDAIRNAISVGGDSDTLAAITGGIADAYYGVPKNLEKQAVSYLDDRLKKIYREIIDD